MYSDDAVIFTPIYDPSLKPYKGQRFNTLDEGVHFYRNYARNVGFDTRLSAAKKVDDVFTRRYVVCSREGVKYAHEKSFESLGMVNPNSRKRISSRYGCKARVLFKYIAYLGQINLFVEEHNHEMVEVQHRHFMRVNQNLDSVHQQFILHCAKATIGPTAAHRLLSELLGGNDVVGCSVMEVQNFARDMKAFVDGCDAQMLLNKMRKKKSCSDSFTYHFEVDGEDKLTRLFWCDPISKWNYHLSGDVVAFDTTYSTNKYCLIFAPFTGKDNHDKPIIFAAGLLSKEDAASFCWLFEKFISCMGLPPKLIITDQDLGMKVAVERVLEGTRHHWCMWHIMHKVADKISKELRADEDFKKELNACVWSDLIEPDLFDESWFDIMEMFGLVGDQWFESMFENRKFWVLAYFCDFPMSGLLRTTSISESENSFYKRYTRSRSNLLEFWMHYNHALDAQRQNNAKLNYLDKSFSPNMCTQLAIEKYASSVYTGKILRKVQEEVLSACYNCRIDNMTGPETKREYKIIDEFKEIYDVSYDDVSEDYECSCKMFRRMGLLCSHVFCVLKNKLVLSIPDKYVSGRWKKSHLIEPVHGFTFDDLNSHASVDENRRLTHNIMSSMYLWLHKLDGDSQGLSKFLSGLDELGKSIGLADQQSEVGDKRQLMQNFYGVEKPDTIEVFSPDVVKTKGSGSRKKSRLEKATEIMKKPLRRCTKCNQMARHDSRNCGKINKKA